MKQANNETPIVQHDLNPSAVHGEEVPGFVDKDSFNALLQTYTRYSLVSGGEFHTVREQFVENFIHHLKSVSSKSLVEYLAGFDEWSSSDSNGQVRWNSFVQSFNLRTLGGGFAPYQKKTIYFRPDCHHQPPLGRTGGENFGVLAKIPVLAK